MKQYLFFLVRHHLWTGLLLFFCSLYNTAAKAQFIPMLKDGRVWKCIEFYLADEKNDTVAREYKLNGTSEIDGRICYNLCLGNKVVEHYYEDGPKVYRHTASGWEQLFDFSMPLGEEIPNSGGLMVSEVKTIVMKGTARRCVCFPLVADDGTRMCWIEGIGSSDSGPVIRNVAIGSLISIKLLSVYDGEDCIFETSDMYADVNVIGNVLPNDRSSKQCTYDLQGCRIGSSKFAVHSSQLRKGIYIRQGRKRVVR